MLNKTNLPTVKERCENCRYWWDNARDGWPEDGDDHAPCRRFPPHPLPNGQLLERGLPVNQYPITLASDWCGEWRAKQHNAPPAPPGQ